MVRIKNLLSGIPQRPAAEQRDTTVILAGIAFLGLGATFTTYWIWTTGQPIAALWVGLTLWLTVLVAGMSFWLLSLGRQS